MYKAILTTDPATDTPLNKYEQHSDEALDKALKQAAKTFSTWRYTSFTERASLLRNIAAAIAKNKTALAELCVQEMGKPIKQATDELDKCILCLKHYAANGKAYLQNEPVQTEGRKSYITYNPLGTVLAIMPWNFPYWQVFRGLAPIVMSGNTMLLKHASNVSGCALAIADIMKKAGAPKGLFDTLIIESSRVEAVIARPEISAVTFTGSSSAGAAVAATAAKHLKKQVLELGGSDAYIILEDADIQKAVETCVAARLVNTGQSCLAAKRFVVVKSVYKDFEAAFVAAMKAASFGDPMDRNNAAGPMARTDLRNELHEQVQQSIAKGAKLLCGGYIPEMPGAFYPPTVLGNIKRGMPAYDEEIFGPVAALIVAKDEADAIRIANDSIYGLGGAVFSKDLKRAERIAAEALEAGNCFVNAQVHSNPLMPFGGVKQSGYGRELGYYGIREFTNVKSVFVSQK